MKEKQLEQCLEVLNFLRDNHFDKYQFFQGPAEHALDEPLKSEYRKQITEPRDLGSIREKLNNNTYESIAGFQEDVLLCFNNAKKFCKTRFPDVARVAENLLRTFRLQMDKLLNSITATAAPVTKVSTPTTPVESTPRGSDVAVSSSSSAASLPPKTAPVLRLSVGSKAPKSVSPANVPAVPFTAPIVSSPAAILPMFKAKCEQILRELMKMEYAKILMEPVDLLSYPAYGIIIPHPMDFSTMLSRLQKVGGTAYNHHNEFALDARRVVGNFLRYNCTKDDFKLRQFMVKILTKFEKLWQKLEETTNSAEFIFSKPMASLPQLLGGIEELYKTDGIMNFIYPSRYYFQGPELTEYLKVIRRPMDVGSVVSNIIEGLYTTNQDIIDDMSLIANNCKTYWAANMVNGKLTADAEEYIRQSAALKDCMVRVVQSAAGQSAATPAPAAVAPKATSSKGSTSTASSSAPKTSKASSSAAGATEAMPVLTLKKPTKVKVILEEPTPMSAREPGPEGTTVSTLPPIKPVVTTAPLSLMTRLTAAAHLLTPITVNASTSAPSNVEKRSQAFLKDMFKACIDELKKHFIFSPIINAPILTSAPFLKAVDPILFPDYLTIIHYPMDINKIEKKVQADRYPTVNAIFADIELIRSNAHTYNVGENGVEVRIMADQLNNYFRYLIKICLLELYLGHYDDAVAAKVVTDDLREKLLVSGNSADVVTYLKAMVAAEGREYNDYVMYHFGANARRTLAPAASSSATVKTEGSGSAKKKHKDHTGENDHHEKGHKKRKDHKDHGDGAFSAGNLNINVGSAEGYSMSVDLFDDDVAPPKAKKHKTSASTGLGGSGATSSTHKHHKKHRQSESGAFSPELMGVNDGGAAALPELLPPAQHGQARPLEPWEQNIDLVLRNVMKNPYVDNSKPGSAIANFFIPLRGGYHKPKPSPSADPDDNSNKIDEDMNLTELIRLFNAGLIKDELDFVNKLLGIFQHVVDHLNPEETEFARKLHRGCAHLVDYCWWQCLEHLNPFEVVPIVKRAPAFMIREFTIAARDEQRTKREGLLKEPTNSINNNLCKRVLKDLEKGSHRGRAKEIDFFKKPVDDKLLADYPMYVRKPMDLGTVTTKLEEGRYRSYCDFMDDCRRVFSNAIKYNGHHKETDTTGLSLLIYNAAMLFQSKLEGLLAKFTVESLDKMIRQRFIDEEFAKVRAAQEQQQRQERQAEKEFLGTLMEQSQREKQLQQKEEKKRKRAEMLGISASNLDELDDDDEDIVPIAKSMKTSSSSKKRNASGEDDDYADDYAAGADDGFAVDDSLVEYQHVPARFIHLIRKKRLCQQRAWNFYLPHAVVGDSSKPQSESTRNSNSLTTTENAGINQENVTPMNKDTQSSKVSAVPVPKKAGLISPDDWVPAQETASSLPSTETAGAVKFSLTSGAKDTASKTNKPPKKHILSLFTVDDNEDI
jgi:hypothetical protein